jgi:hypothetical protein
MADGLIELGERAVFQARSRRGRRPHPRTLAGLVAVAVLFGVAGSGGSPPRLAGPVWTMADVAGFRPGQDTVYTLTSGIVEARAADTGHLRWRLSTGGRVEDAVEIGHGLVAISFGPPAASANVDSGDTTIVARVTDGDSVATANGHPVAWSDERLLLDRHGCASRPLCDTVSAVSLPEAATQWSIETPTVRTFSLDHAAGVFGVQTDDELHLRSWSTGTMLRSQPLSREANADGTGSGSRLLDRTPYPDAYGAVVAGRLVAVRRVGSQVTVDGQPLAGAAGGWSLTIPAVPGRRATAFLNAQACGQLLCVFVDSDTAVIDPATGVLRGHIAGLVISDHFSDVPSRYLMVQSLEDSSTGLQVLRASDLSVLASLPLAAQVPWQSSDGRVMVSRLTADGISLAVIDRRGHQRPIGSVAGGEIECAAYGLILICLDLGILTTWRIPGTEQLAAGVGDGRP